MSRPLGKQFNSETGRKASLKSPWRHELVCHTTNASALREGFNDGWAIEYAPGLSPIGVAVGTRKAFGVIARFLSSAGWETAQIHQITHENDAAAVRQAGGLVVHIEPLERPHFEGHITTAGFNCREGDFVLTNARNPGEYLPRLLGKLSRLPRGEQ